MKNKQKLNEIVLLDEAHETGKDSPADVMNISSGVIITFVYFLLILTFPFSLFCCFKVIYLFSADLKENNSCRL